MCITCVPDTHEVQTSLLFLELGIVVSHHLGCWEDNQDLLRVSGLNHRIILIFPIVLLNLIFCVH